MQPESSPGVSLRALVEENGQLVYDPDKTLQLLLQSCPGFVQEVQVLVEAQRASLPWELLNLGPEPKRETIEELASTLESKTGMPSEAAHWALQNWAYALDIDLVHLIEPQEEHSSGATLSSEGSEPPVEQPSKPAASPSAKYFVIDGPNRWGPASISTLNEWAGQGRLHGNMLFESEESGERYSAHEMPGLFIPTAAPQQPIGAYYRASGHLEGNAAVTRKVNAALVKSVLLVLFCCIVGGGVSLLLGFYAKLELAKGRIESANKLAGWADFVTYASIPFGLIGTYYEVAYFIAQYHRMFG